VKEPTESHLGPSASGLETDTRADDKVRRFSAIQLLIAIVLWIAATPFLDTLKYADLIEAVLLTLVLFSAVIVVGANRQKLVTAVVLVIPSLAGKWVNHFWPHAMPTEAFLMAGILFVAFVVVDLFHFLHTTRRVTVEVLCIAASNYLLIGLLWMFAYLLVATLLPDSFIFPVGLASQRLMGGFNALYFSFVTLSTLGFGDIIPVSRVARMLSIVEATTGMFYVTFLVSRLVALHSSETARNAQALGKKSDDGVR
jgi:hypothetical protein